MERTEHPALSECFGLDYSPWSSECKRCVLFHMCGKQYEFRVPLSRLTFELTPPALFAKDETAVIGDIAIHRSNVEDLYRRCFYVVYGERWPCRSNLSKDWQNIVKNAQTAGVDLHVFIAVTMAHYSLTHPNTEFYVRLLTAETSVDKIKRQTALLRERYGHDGMDALGMFIDTTAQRIEEKMLLSESLAGKWIVTWKLSRDGNPTESLYRMNELRLDPYWLATEQTYIEGVLKPYLNQTNESDAIKWHRERVLATHSMLKQRKTLARTVFSARSQIMPAAVVSVLRHVGHTPENFTHADKPVTDSIRFWNVLGLAVCHWECHKALDTKPNRLWR